MSFIPLAQQVEVWKLGPPTVDPFNNERPGEGHWVPLKVAQWWTQKSDEEAGDSVLRTIDYLTVHSPVLLDAASRIRLPDGSVWSVEGNAEDHNHGWHGWSPGLFAIHARKVEG